MDLYFTSTPYHILTCCSIAHENGSKAHLICAPSFKNSSSFFSAFREWKENPFEEITRLTSTYDRSLPRRWAMRSRQSITTRRLARKHSPERVYVTNDPSPVEQALLEYSPESATRVYVEDGTAAYTSRKIPTKPTWKQIAGKLIYGSWWQPINVYGTSHWIDKIAVTHPEHVRSELREYPKRRITPDYLINMDSNWIKKYFSRLHYDTTELNNIKTIVVPPVSTIKSPKEAKEFRHQLSEETDLSRAAVKYHPRETKDDYLDIRDKGVILPQSLPVELLYIAMEEVTTVIGSISTSLLSAKWMDDNLRVISLAKSFDINDPNLIQAFQGIGVEVR